MDGQQDNRLSRRQLGIGVAAAGGAAVVGVGSPAGAAGNGGKGGRDAADSLTLVNGNIVTLDARGSVARELAVEHGRVVEVGRKVRRTGRVVNLEGATVVPGLIDSHQHFMRACHNPGHETRDIESATSVAELQQALEDKAAQVPAGEFLTCIGGWNRNGLAETRLPTVAELDDAAPAHPVYLSETGGGGQGVANSLARTFFESAGVAVNPDTGTLTPAAGRAALVAVQTFEDKRQGTAEGIAHVSGLGMTMINDVGGALLPDWVHANTLWRADQLDLRLRQFFTGFEFPTLDAIKTFVDNNHNKIGDDVFRVIGVGERLTSGSTADVPTLTEAAEFLSERGWTLILHSLSNADNTAQIAVFQEVAQTHDIAAMRWQLHHINDITPENLQLVADLGIPVGLQSYRYTSASGATPFRRVLDLGIRAGGGSDATNVAAQNPWLMIYHMVSGRNNAGVLINGDQRISRLEALRLYTLGSAYLTGDEHQLGSLEVGKYADLAVLSADYLKVPEDQIRKLRSQLTLQGGRAVHATGRYASILG